jgi:transcriptional regulator GlxA family with amidase domain
MLFTEVDRQGATQSMSFARSGLPPIAALESKALRAPLGQGHDVAHASGAAAQPRWHRGGLAPRALQRVREFIEAHLEDRISIQMLAAIAGLSTYHFARAFKQSAGVTPHDYLVRRRVTRVQELLADTDLPLSEIAVAVGFADQSHCARRFREHVGLSPSRYRWSMR